MIEIIAEEPDDSEEEGSEEEGSEEEALVRPCAKQSAVRASRPSGRLAAGPLFCRGKHYRLSVLTRKKRSRSANSGCDASAARRRLAVRVLGPDASTRFR